ncbi:MAG TPA: septum formation initiator family protein [Pyrinomonadaceae bacterium]|nr:septum formation initiator family protein [Pyrinomonadaceae bacterium]
MNKVANIYWNNPQPLSMRKRAKKNAKSATPQWFVFTVVASLTFMLCLAINLRAFSEMSQETEQFEQLNFDINRLNNENMLIQQDINSLKTDKDAIEREARRIGLTGPK